MRAWAYLMGGLLIWAVHFFVIYIAGSIFLTSTTTRVLTVAVTLPLLGAAAWLFWTARRARREDALDSWTDQVAGWSGAAAFLAVLWQSWPAFLI